MSGPAIVKCVGDSMDPGDFEIKFSGDKGARPASGDVPLTPTEKRIAYLEKLSSVRFGLALPGASGVAASSSLILFRLLPITTEWSSSLSLSSLSFLCPVCVRVHGAGMGYDCFRTWEMLMMGAIPVIERGVGLDRTVRASLSFR